MSAAGAPAKVIDAARAKWQAQQPEHPHLIVHPVNIPAFRVLLATADQWDTPGAFGGRLALSLVEVEAAMRLLQIPVSEDTSLRVMTMLRVAREIKVQQFNKAMAKA